MVGFLCFFFPPVIAVAITAKDRKEEFCYKQYFAYYVFFTVVINGIIYFILSFLFRPHSISASGIFSTGFSAGYITFSSILALASARILESLRKRKPKSTVQNRDDDIKVSVEFNRDRSNIGDWKKPRNNSNGASIEKSDLIQIKDLWKIYPMGKIEIQALKGVNLVIAEGDFISIAGPSGSGKTTLLNIIGLIDNFSEGSMTIDNLEIKDQSRKELARLRRELIGFVFQSFNLLPVLNVFENVELPFIISKKGGSKAERTDRINYLLEEVGLADRRNHIPAELSGGEQQRVAIARALASSPRIILADEPTGNLDSNTGGKVLELMKEINRLENTTFIFSTHDPEIWKMAAHTIFLQDGNIRSRQVL